MELAPFADLGLLGAVLFVLYFLGRMYFQVREKEADAKVKEAEVELRAVELEATAKVKAAELETEASKVRAQLEVERSEREAKLAESLATYHRETAAFNTATMTALASITGAQKQTTSAVAKSQKHIAAQVTGSQTVVIESIEKLGTLMTTAFEVFARDQEAFSARVMLAINAFAEEAVAQQEEGAA